jgi:hypothetical protein
MSDLDLFTTAALKTGENSRMIRRRGFVLTGPEESSADLDPECMLDLFDLPESGMVDWDALGFGCREPFFTSMLRARKKPKPRKKQVARAAHRCRITRTRFSLAAQKPGTRWMLWLERSSRFPEQPDAERSGAGVGG